MKVKENRLRRKANRQALKLSKSGTRDPDAMDFGLYALLDIETGGAIHLLLADRWTRALTLDEVEERLMKEVG